MSFANANGVNDQYVHPQLAKEIPILAKYCDPNFNKVFNQDVKHHCDNLDRLMFKAANEFVHGKDYYFQKITKGVHADEKWETQNHINGLMERTEQITVVIKTCQDFEAVCEKFKKNINSKITIDPTTDTNYKQKDDKQDKQEKPKKFRL